VATLDSAANSVTFSPDGSLIAAGTSDHRVLVWSGTGAPKEYKGHVAAVTGVAFRPDGKQLASVGNDGTIRFWDVP
jgi:WD40 repeat protein